MSKDVVFKLNLSGLNEIMKSGQMQSIVNSAAQQALGALGEGYEMESAHPISFIAIASVRASTYKAKLENNRDQTILKAIGGVKI